MDLDTERIWDQRSPLPPSANNANLWDHPSRPPSSLLVQRKREWVFSYRRPVELRAARPLCAVGTVRREGVGIIEHQVNAEDSWVAQPLLNRIPVALEPQVFRGVA